MKRFLPSATLGFAVLFSLVVLMCIMGCNGQTIGQQLQADRVLFDAQLQTLHAGFTTGLIPKSVIADTLPYEHSTEAGLAAAQRAAASGDGATAKSLLVGVEAGLAKLATYLPAKTTATTQP